MHQCAYTNINAFSALSEERAKLGKLVGVFGLSYIIGTIVNATKSFHMEQVENLLKNKIAFYYLWTFALNLMIDIMPISTIYILHRSNFENPVERLTDPRDETSALNSNTASGGSDDSTVSNAIDRSNNCGLLGVEA